MNEKKNINKYFERAEIFNKKDKILSFLNQKIPELTFDNYKYWIKELSEIDALVREINNVIGMKKLLKTDYLIEEQILIKQINEIYSSFKKELFHQIDEKNPLLTNEKEFLVWIKNSKKKFDIQSKNNNSFFIDEKKLKMEYIQIINKRDLNFDKKMISIKELEGFLISDNESIRKKSWDYQRSILKTKKEHITLIFNNLVQVRNNQARELGFSNYTNMINYHQCRICTENEIDIISRYFIEKLLPVVKKVNQIKLKQYNLNSIKPWDINIIASSNNIRTFQIEEKVLLSRSFEIIENLFTDKQIDINKKKLVVQHSKGQLFNSFCIPFPYSETVLLTYPSIKTVNSLINYAHEFGHAIHYLLSMNHSDGKIQSFIPTETLEFPSLLMELIILNEITEKESNNYLHIQHIDQMMRNISNGLIYFYFQKYCYDYPHTTPLERAGKFKEFYRKYSDGVDWGSDHSNLDIEWMLNQHVFISPFYGNDYLVGQVYALITYIKMLDRPNEIANNLYSLLARGSIVDIGDIEKQLEIHLNEDNFNLVRNYLINTLQEKMFMTHNQI